MLTDRTIKQLVPGLTAKKYTDRDGLYLLVTPAGKKWWRFYYWFAGKQRTISMGVYDKVSLAQARDKVRAARDLVAAGKDPSRVRQESRRVARAGVTFSTVGKEWVARRQVSPSTARRTTWILTAFLYPAIGRIPVGELTATDLLTLLQTVEARDVETAHRVRQTASQVLRYAVATQRAARDVTIDLRGALKPIQHGHFAAIIEPSHIGALLLAIDDLDGSLIVRSAMQLAPLVFVRPGELRRAEWTEFNLFAATWRIPAKKMKMRDDHIVPLSTQAVAILLRLQAFTGGGQYVFPAVRTPRRPMSDGTMNAGLRRLGYTSDQMTGHGFRAMARTVLSEVLEEDPYVIEAQLAHAVPGPLGDTYNRSQYLKQRRVMMQRWADYLDGLRASQRQHVVSIASTG